MDFKFPVNGFQFIVETFSIYPGDCIPEKPEHGYAFLFAQYSGRFTYAPTMIIQGNGIFQPADPDGIQVA